MWEVLGLIDCPKFFSYYNKSISNPNYGDIKMSCFIEFSPVFMNVHHIQHVGIQITE